jgi:hypothetical protein
VPTIDEMRAKYKAQTEEERLAAEHDGKVDRARTDMTKMIKAGSIELVRYPDGLIVVLAKTRRGPEKVSEYRPGTIEHEAASKITGDKVSPKATTALRSMPCKSGYAQWSSHAQGDREDV